MEKVRTPQCGEGSVGKYKLRSKLGEGSYSTVWKAENLETGQEVAVKQVYLSKLNHTLKNSLNCELTFLSSVNHPNIIRLFDVLEDENNVVMVLEYCAGGNLASYIQHRGRVQEKIARIFLQQLGAGLEVLHSRRIIHRDLKPENILLSSQANDVVLKIADFGLSRGLDPGQHAETVCGSPLYMAPEVLQFQHYDDKKLPLLLSSTSQAKQKREKKKKVKNGSISKRQSEGKTNPAESTHLSSTSLHATNSPVRRSPSPLPSTPSP